MGVFVLYLYFTNASEFSFGNHIAAIGMSCSSLLLIYAGNKFIFNNFKMDVIWGGKNVLFFTPDGLSIYGNEPIKWQSISGYRSGRERFLKVKREYVDINATSNDAFPYKLTNGRCSYRLYCLGLYDNPEGIIEALDMYKTKYGKQI